MLVPLPQAVTEFLERHANSGNSMSLENSLEQFILRKTTLTVPPETWLTADIPMHLRMNIQVVDDAGEELAMSRDLSALQMQLGNAAQQDFMKRDREHEKIAIERDHITHWDFSDLPEIIAVERNGQQLNGYPALVDQADSVAIRVFDTAAAADSAMRLGVRRLLCLELKNQLKQLEKNLPGLNQAALQMTMRINPGDLKQDMLNAIIDRALLADDPLPRSETEFTAQCQRAKNRLPEVTAVLARLLQQIGSEYQALIGKLSSLRSDAIRNELTGQLEHLVYPGFLSHTSLQRLLHVPRYLKGMSLRLEKFSANPLRDARHSMEIAPLWQQYCQRLEKHQKTGVMDENLEEFRWQIEELRISLFAQELKTPSPVSAKRLQKLWESVRP